MAHINNGKVVLDHTGQQIDDNIDEVVDARGEYSSLAEAIAASGGGTYSETELLAAPVVGDSASSISPISLTDSISNYDQLVFQFGVTADNLDQRMTQTILCSDLKDNVRLFLFLYLTTTYNLYYSVSKNANMSSITVNSIAKNGWSEPATIFSIKGIKY